MKTFDKSAVLGELFIAGKRVQGVSWNPEQYVEVKDGQAVDQDGKPYDILKSETDKWKIWEEPVKESGGAVVNRADALNALFNGKRIRAVNWGKDKSLFVKDGQIMINGSEPYNIMAAKEDQWVIVEDAADSDDSIAELKEMIQALLQQREPANDAPAPALVDGRHPDVQANTLESLKALYGVTTPAEVLEQFRQRLEEAKSTRDVTVAVVEYIPFAWVGGKTIGTAKTYYTKLRNVAREIKNDDYRELALTLCLPPQSLYEAVQQQTDDAKKAKIRDEESFEIEHMEAIIAKLREMIEGGDDAIMETKTRQQTLERAKAYVYATYLALTTGRRMIEILKTLRIEKRGSEWVYCGIAKDRSEDEKCIKAYALDNDFVFLSELLQYVQEHIKETGGENMTPTQINSKFNNPFNNAFKRLTGTGFTFKDSRDIFAELLWDKEGKSGSWVDQRDFRAEVLGHEYDKSLSTPEHYMGLRGVRNEK